MGSCLSCCGGSSDADIYAQGARTTGTDGAYAPPRPQKPDTPEDRAARLAAAEAAQSRQAKFEHSAVGRATLKSVKAVQAERQAGRPPAGKDTAGDWLS
ncbi:hypothetical protein ACKKBG_A17085 [Auxenochlorella protothecoides x Auxenochlorella symbiontica]